MSPVAIQRYAWVPPSRPSTLSTLRLVTLPLPFTAKGASADVLVVALRAAPAFVRLMVVTLELVLVLPAMRALPVVARATVLAARTSTVAPPITARTVMNLERMERSRSLEKAGVPRRRNAPRIFTQAAPREVGFPLI